jgi:hypothetical protein
MTSWNPAGLKKDDRVTLLADCAAQAVVWDRADLGPPRTPARTRQDTEDSE